MSAQQHTHTDRWDDLNEAHYSFPSYAETKQYRDTVRERILNYIDTVEFAMPITWESKIWPVIMGIEHERIHLETSAVLIRELPLDMVKPHPMWRACPYITDAAPQNELVEVASGTVRVGREEVLATEQDSVYGWDVDYGVQSKEVAGFSASKFMVSNKEFHDFMQDGGYTTDAYWTEEGLGWRNFRKAERPHFWQLRKDEAGNDKLMYRMWAEEIELPWSWPAEVCNHEAKAFCNWKGAKTGKKIRLPTECEWSLLWDRFVAKDQWEWEEGTANVNLEAFMSPCPVDMHKHGELYDVVGNLWHHTETPIGPLNGFKVHPLYDDFSMPTFDGDHAMQKGGCFISTGNEATRDARFGFRRHFYQFIGIRYIEGEEADEYADFYAADPVVDQYTEFHWGPRTAALGEEAFPVKLGKLVVEECTKHNVPLTLGMDVGCRSGRTSFTMAEDFDQVQGVDFSARYIMPGCQLRECQQTKWDVPTKGNLSEKRSILAADYELEELIHKTSFWQSDPCNLHPHLTGYSAVVVNLNLLERTMFPKDFLAKIHQRMEPKSLLVVACASEWKNFILKDLEERWVDGVLDAEGNPVTLEAGCDAQLLKNFQRVGKSVLPYSLPLTASSSVVGDCEVLVYLRK